MKVLRIFRRVFAYYAEHRVATVVGTVATVASGVVGLLAPGIVRRAIDRLTAGTSAGHMWLYGAELVAVAVVSGVFLFLQRRLLVGVSRHLEHRLRIDLYHHLLHLPTEFYMRERVGDLLTRATSDIAAVRLAVGPAYMYTVSTATVMVVAGSLMVRIDPVLTVLSLLVLPLVAVTTRYFGSRIHVRWGVAQETLSQYTARLQEHLVGVRVLRAFNCEDNEKRLMHARNQDYVAANERLIALQALFRPFLQALIGVSFVVVLGVGGNAVRTGSMTLGEFVEFNLYLVRMIWPMVAIGFVANMVQRGAASMARIEQLFDREPLIAPPTGHGGASTSPARLDLAGVSFSYSAAAPPAVAGVDLAIAPGERIALVGGIGSGKSTLLSLIPRILEPPPGTVLLDGRDVLDLPLPELRRQVALVPQGSFLFSISLRENIALARPDASEEEVAAAVRSSGLESDLDELPAGLDTVIGERGVTLSGGQRQRVSIARAILARPRLLLLDDCLSAVDTRTERDILAGLPETSLLFATHRLAAAELCDRVLVLERGRVIEEGTPAALAAAGGRYAHLLALQRLEALELPDERSA